MVTASPPLLVLKPKRTWLLRDTRGRIGIMRAAVGAAAVFLASASEHIRPRT